MSDDEEIEGPDEPTKADIDATLRLSRKYVFHGEPYAPAVYGLARMLAAYRRELEEQHAHR